jgi:hypothetical protein
VKEQSQIEDMRAAVRGDLERSRVRRQSLEPAPVPAPPPEKEPPPTAPRRRGILARLFRA